MATANQIAGARLALPHLVYCAKMKNTITYQDLGDRIDRHAHFVLPGILGYIREDICGEEGLPYISAIVVNKYTRMPGRGFLPGGTDHLSKEEYRKAFEEIRDKVFACREWDSLLKKMGLSPLTKTPEDLNRDALQYIESQKKNRGGGESRKHKYLKTFVAENPYALGFSVIKRVQKEFPFVSGDRCDVVFDLGDKGFAVVEIKLGTKEKEELTKGVYQAIKYRALMEAQGWNGVRSVKAFLVAHRIPKDIVGLAKNFEIECKVLPEIGIKRLKGD